MTDQPVDQAVLNQLIEDTGEEVFQEIVASFLATTRERIALIQNAIENDDGHLLDHTAHSVKSSARAMGARHLGGLAEELERMATDGRLGDAKSALPEFLEEARRVVDVFEKMD